MGLADDDYGTGYGDGDRDGDGDGDGIGYGFGDWGNPGSGHSLNDSGYIRLVRFTSRRALDLPNTEWRRAQRYSGGIASSEKP